MALQLLLLRRGNNGIVLNGTCISYTLFPPTARSVSMTLPEHRARIHLLGRLKGVLQRVCEPHQAASWRP